MSVGLLVVRLLYRLYVCVHLSKWFTFFLFLVVCLLLSCRLLRLLVTDTCIKCWGLRASSLSAETKADAGQNAKRNHLNPNVLYMMLAVVFILFVKIEFLNI